METLQVVFTAIVQNAPFLVGFILPPFVEVINRDVKESWLRFIVSMTVCFIAGIILHWDKIATGDPGAIITYSSIIFVESQTVYKLYFEKSNERVVLQDRINSVIKRETNLSG